MGRKLAAIVTLSLTLIGSVHSFPQSGKARGDVRPLTLPGGILSSIQEPDAQQMVLGVPEGAQTLIIRPVAGLAEEDTGTIEALDSTGHLLRKDQSLPGLAIKMATPGFKVRCQGDMETDPLRIDLPTNTARVEILGQYYDEEGNPMSNGAVRCYDRAGNLLMEEDGLELDLFMF